MLIYPNIMYYFIFSLCGYSISLVMKLQKPKAQRSQGELKETHVERFCNNVFS